MTNLIVEDALRKAFPDSKSDWAAFTTRLVIVKNRGPHFPALRDQLDSLERLENSLKDAVRGYNELEGARPSFLDHRYHFCDDQPARAVQRSGLKFKKELDRLLSAVTSQLIQEEKRNHRNRNRTDWLAVSIVLEVILRWRDEELSKPIEKGEEFLSL